MGGVRVVVPYSSSALLRLLAACLDEVQVCLAFLSVLHSNDVRTFFLHVLVDPFDDALDSRCFGRKLLPKGACLRLASVLEVLQLLISQRCHRLFECYLLNTA